MWTNAQRENWLQSVDRLSLPGDELLPVSKLVLSRQQFGVVAQGRWALPEHAAGIVGVPVLLRRWAISLGGGSSSNVRVVFSAFRRASIPAQPL
eukprot:3588120-Lingulodinium_polyedra.AAC.1